MSSPLLSAKSLSRSFGQQHIVKQLEFEVYKGEVLGFLGPNGAGKSTSMKMLSGNLAPSEGEIMINGYDLFRQPKQAKANIGYLPEQPPLYKELTVAEYLRFCAKLNLIPRQKQKSAIDTVIGRCGLSQVTRRLIGQLSKGYQQRVGIAQAIIHTPAVVILDEPTSGLDPIQILEIRELIKDIAQQHSVILSTHILPEVNMLCDKVKIINHGQLVFEGSTQSLQEQTHASHLLVHFDAPPTTQQLNSIPGITAVTPISKGQYQLHYSPEDNPTQTVLSEAVSQQWQLTMMTQEQHSLEEVFMNIIQQEQQPS